MSDVLDIRVSPRVDAGFRIAAFVELAKPRILALVLVANAVGFYLALPLGSDWTALVVLVHTLVGTALVVAGANALNQYGEVDHDARMDRTADRPLPSGRLGGGEALAFGVTACTVGTFYLVVFTNPLTGMLAAASCANYVFIYTPLKRRTSLCVFAGAVSGALPPVIGWTAAAGELQLGAWMLFAIVFFWQLPHFASIAWLFRDDYARAGFPMIPVVDALGVRLDVHVITHTITLLIASLLPALYGGAGPAYALGAMALGLAFLGCSAMFVRDKTSRIARCHVLASIIYLPALFALMMLDRALAL
jgi:protoheme IX farnesyltransferase